MSASELNFSDLDGSDVESFLREVEAVTDTSTRKSPELKPVVTADDSAKKSKKKLKKRIEKLQKELDRKDADLANADIQINELKLANENAQRKITRLTSEIASLRQQLTSKDVTEDLSNDKIEHVVSLFEGMVRQQSQEICQLADQRDSLIMSVRILDKVCHEYQEEMSDMAQEEQKKSDIIERVSQRCEENEQEMANLAKSVLDISGIETSETESSYSYVKRAVEELKQRDVAIQKESADDGKLAMLSQIEGAVQFFHNMTRETSNVGGELVKDESLREMMLEQCKKMEGFIKDNLEGMDEVGVSHKLSLFDPASVKNPETKLSDFFGLVKDEDLEKPAMRELYALFAGTLQVNRVVVDYAEQIKSVLMKMKMKKSQKAKAIEDWMPELAEQARGAMEEIRRRGGHVVDETDVIPWLVSSWNDQTEQEKVLVEGNYLSLNRDELQIFRDQLDKLEEDVLREKQMGEVRKRMFENQLESLTNEREALKTKLQEVKAQVKEYKGKYKQAVAQQLDISRAFDEFQASVNDIVREKKTLEKAASEFKTALKKQNDQIIMLTSKERKLKAKKEELTDKLQDMESQNKRILSEIKRRSETMKARYDSTVSSLQNDLEDATANLEREKAAKQELANQKQAMSNELTKMRIAQRALQLKVATLEDRQSLERNIQSAKTNSYVMSLSTSTDKKIEEANAQIENIKMWITNILEIKFDEQVPTNATIDDLFVLLQDKMDNTAFDQKVLADALELRKKLDVPRQTQLSSMWNELQNTANEDKTKLEETQNELLRLQLEISSDKEENQDKEWRSWATSLCDRISQSNSSQESPDKLRAMIEEHVSSSMHESSISETGSSEISTLNSLRPIMTAVAFIERMKKPPSESVE